MACYQTGHHCRQLELRPAGDPGCSQTHTLNSASHHLTWLTRKLGPHLPSPLHLGWRAAPRVVSEGEHKLPSLSHRESGQQA